MNDVFVERMVKKKFETTDLLVVIGVIAAIIILSLWASMWGSWWSCSLPSHCL